MTHKRDSMVLAVDGGGTRCRLALDWCDGRVSIEVGSANVSSDFNAATTEISNGLKQLSEESGIEMGELNGFVIVFALEVFHTGEVVCFPFLMCHGCICRE